MSQASLKKAVTRELALFTGLVLAGLVLLPIALYVVGGTVFGEYGGAGFGDFYRGLSGRLRDGQGLALLFVLSPYLLLQILRLTAAGWRRAAQGG